MRKERILAVIMSVLLALSILPMTVFAAETTVLDGKLKIHGGGSAHPGVLMSRISGQERRLTMKPRKVQGKLLN